MLNTSVFEFPASRSVLAGYLPFQSEIEEDLCQIPALPETLLAMELQIGMSGADLSELAETVLSDLGATIQVLRLAGREYGDSPERPIRIEDCICDLGLRECLEAAAKGVPLSGSRKRAVLEMWEHSREIAQYCKQIAEETPGVIPAHEAYLAGLLHAIGALPGILDWDQSEALASHVPSALEMAEKWSLPGFLKTCYRDAETTASPSRLSKIVDAAHQLAKRSWARCPLADLPMHAPVRVQR